MGQEWCGTIVSWLKQARCHWGGSLGPSSGGHNQSGSLLQPGNSVQFYQGIQTSQQSLNGGLLYGLYMGHPPKSPSSQEQLCGQPDGLLVPEERGAFHQMGAQFPVPN